MQISIAHVGDSRGGTLIFTFDRPTDVDEVRLLDIQRGKSAMLRAYNKLGRLVATQTLYGQKEQGLQAAVLNAAAVSRLEIQFSGRGAVADIVFCRELVPEGSVHIAGAATTTEGTPYALQLNRSGLNVDRWTINWGDGDIENITGMRVNGRTHLRRWICTATHRSLCVFPWKRVRG